MKFCIHQILILALFTGFAHANASSPQQIVEEIFKKASNKKINNSEQAQEEINKYIDFSEMAKNVLGSIQNSQNAQEITWFENTLKEIITRTVYPEAPKFLKAVKISYKGARTNTSDKVKIASIVKSKGEVTEVDYMLRKVGESWRVVDISIDGESWTASIANEVQKTVQKKQWGGLKDKLNHRLMSLRAGKKMKAGNDDSI